MTFLHMSEQKKLKLKPNQNRALSVLLATGNITRAAEVANVHRRTVDRWLKEPTFQKILAEAEATALEALARSMAFNAGKAAACLLGVIEDPEATRAEKIKAARYYLASLPQARLLGRIESTLLKLMRQQNES